MEAKASIWCSCSWTDQDFFGDQVNIVGVRVNVSPE